MPNHKKGQQISPLSAIDYQPEQFPKVALSYQEALKYLRGEALVLPEDTPKGMVTMTYKGIALGPDNGLDDGKLVVLQRVIRLHGRVFVVGPGHNPDLMSGLSKVFHRAAGRCGQSVACGEKVV
jgi:hypothetical protein